MESYSSLTDSQLLSRAGTDGEAFAEFYRRHSRGLLQFFLRRTGDVEMAADLTAETFAEAYFSRRRFRDIGAPGFAWVLTIARRKLARSLRRGRLEQSARKRLGVPPIELDDDDFRRVEAMVDFEPLRDELRRGLTALPLKQSQALELRIGRELPYAEVAARLNCSEGAARVRVARGLTRLAGLVEDAGIPDVP
jgi:RNA polymerase sigma factor (sigma-70 family)